MNDWNTKPTVLPRYSVSSFSVRSSRFFPSTTTAPEVGVSSAPIIWSRVVFPLPLSPLMAVIDPLSILAMTPRSARTGALRPFISKFFLTLSRTTA